MSKATAILIGMLLTSGALGGADDPRAVIAEAQRRGESKSQRYDGLLQTADSSGNTTEKRWTYERIGSYGQSKSVIRFTEPPEVRGVALLVVNHPDRASDQWMWTPAIERDRRIALQDRSTRFFGTDFTFEDLEERDVDQYDYSLLGEDSVTGARSWRIESIPKEARSSQYTKSILWIRQDDYAFARVDLYVKNEIVRRLEYTRITNIQGIWTPLQTTMTDARRRSRTRLTLDKVQYNIPARDEDFTLQALRRP